MQRRYITVDVFTDKPLAATRLPWCSTPAAVDGADAGDRDRVQLFRDYLVLPPQDKANDAQGPHLHDALGNSVCWPSHVGTAFVLATRAAQAPAD